MLQESDLNESSPELFKGPLPSGSEQSEDHSPLTQRDPVETQDINLDVRGFTLFDVLFGDRGVRDFNSVFFQDSPPPVDIEKEKRRKEKKKEKKRKAEERRRSLEQDLERQQAEIERQKVEIEKQKAKVEARKAEAEKERLKAAKQVRFYSVFSTCSISRNFRVL